MGIQRINIDYQLAEIGVRSNRAGLRISNNRGQIKINNVRPELNIKTQAPSFKVNKKIYSEMGLSPPLEFARKFSNEGKTAAISGIGKRASDGNFLGALNRPPADKVPLLAKRHATERLGPKQTNIALMPSSGPAELDWQKGSIDINWSKHSVTVDFEGKNTADVSLDPRHSVEVYLRTRPYFRVSVVEAVQTSGRYINSVV